MKDTTADVWTDGCGRKAGTVYFDSLGHRRVVTPPQFPGADGSVKQGAEAVAAMLAHFTEQQAKRQETLRKMPVKVRREYAAYLRTGRLPEARAHAPREGHNDRPRGSRRSSVRRSSQRSGDSGEDGDPSEPPERTCECAPECRADIGHRAPQARYLNDTHAAAARQRRKRARSRDWTADVSRADAYLRHEPEEVARVRRRVEEGCRCNGHHIADPSDGHCLKCGHDRAHGSVLAGFIAARSVETRRPRPELFA